MPLANHPKLFYFITVRAKGSILQVNGSCFEHGQISKLQLMTNSSRTRNDAISGNQQGWPGKGVGKEARIVHADQDS